MSDLAPPEWKWEDFPDTILSDDCANGSCESCGPNPDCKHPCHNQVKE